MITYNCPTKNRGMSENPEKAQVFIAEFMHCWPPSLLVAILRCMHRLVQDPNQEVKDAAAATWSKQTCRPNSKDLMFQLNIADSKEL